jgi:hypothetical protein
VPVAGGGSAPPILPIDIAIFVTLTEVAPHAVVPTRAGFVLCIVGMLFLLLLVRDLSSVPGAICGLFLMGVGLRLTIPSSVNGLHSALPEKGQGAISGVSRSVSNLGSALGTAFLAQFWWQGQPRTTRHAPVRSSRR